MQLCCVHELVRRRGDTRVRAAPTRTLTPARAYRVTYTRATCKERVCVYTRTPRGDRCIARTHLHLDTRDPFDSFLVLFLSLFLFLIDVLSCTLFASTRLALFYDQPP